MDTSQRPAVSVVKTGKTFKVYGVTGKAGMEMPLHYSSKEAVVIIQEGAAVLSIDENKHSLYAGDTFVIPGRQNHSLLLKAEFKAIVVMPLDSVIEFVN